MLRTCDFSNVFYGSYRRIIKRPFPPKDKYLHKRGPCKS